MKNNLIRCSFLFWFTLAPLMSMAPSASADCYKVGLIGGVYQQPVVVCGGLESKEFWGDKWTCVDTGGSSMTCTTGTCFASYRSGSSPSGIACVVAGDDGVGVCLFNNAHPSQRDNCRLDGGAPNLRPPSLPQPSDLGRLIDRIGELIGGVEVPCGESGCDDLIGTTCDFCRGPPPTVTIDTPDVPRESM